MKYLRVYADDEGNSHFEDGEFETNPVDLVEGFPPASFTGAIPVSEVQMFRLEPGDWIDDWHPLRVGKSRSSSLAGSRWNPAMGKCGGSSLETSCWRRIPRRGSPEPEHRRSGARCRLDAAG
ncbi:MAG: hypothetical protein R2849_14670 [Thermomicrobiales bacterium]